MLTKTFVLSIFEYNPYLIKQLVLIYIQPTPDKSDSQGTGKSVRLIRVSEYHANKT